MTDKNLSNFAKLIFCEIEGSQKAKIGQNWLLVAITALFGDIALILLWFVANRNILVIHCIVSDNSIVCFIFINSDDRIFYSVSL